MRKAALEHVGQNFHVAVGMRPEAPARLHSVLVDDAQAAEPHLRRVVIVGKGKGVLAVEPAMLGVPPVFGAADVHHRRRFLTAVTPKCLPGRPADA
jgi:hypothetical protein